MEMSHLGIALIIFIFVITLHQTKALIEDHSNYQSINSVTINDPSIGITQYAVDFDLKIKHGSKYSSHSKENPCRYF